jgi:hypothetical protein
MASDDSWARVWHGLTFVVAAGAVALQFVLVLQGHQHLGDSEAAIEVAGRPDLSTRVIRFFSYLTIWSNVLGTLTAGALLINPRRDSAWWRAIRLDAVVILFGGGIVHFFFLRPLLDLDGADLLADRLLHIVVPLLVVVGWLVFGPRSQVGNADIARFLVLPVVWLAYTLIRGAVVHWYPYPFIDVDTQGYAFVVGACIAVAALLLILAWLAKLLDPMLPGHPVTLQRS